MAVDSTFNWRQYQAAPGTGFTYTGATNRGVPVATPNVTVPAGTVASPGAGPTNGGIDTGTGIPPVQTITNPTGTPTATPTPTPTLPPPPPASSGQVLVKDQNGHVESISAAALPQMLGLGFTQVSDWSGTPMPGAPPASTTSGTPGTSVNPTQWSQFTADLGVGSDTDHTAINTLMQRLQSAGYNVQPGPIDSMGRQDSLVINGKLTRVFNSSGQWNQVQDVNGSAWGAPSSGSNTATGNLAYGLGSGANYGPWTAPWTGTWSAPTADQALNSPGVQFALNNSMRTLENSAAARGVLGNARVQEAISQDLGQQLLGNYNNIFNQALTSYQQNQSDFFANQDRPWNKNLQAGTMGLQASSIGG